jgi:hypothetical protein
MFGSLFVYDSHFLLLLLISKVKKAPFLPMSSFFSTIFEEIKDSLVSIDSHASSESNKQFKMSSNLSMSAIGLLSYFSSKPHRLNFTLKNISLDMKETEEQLSIVLQELIQANLIKNTDNNFSLIFTKEGN